MKRLVVVPDGWPCKLSDCPPGLFVFKETLCLKTDYGEEPPFIANGGEVFWGQALNPEERDNLIVQPCKYEWIEEE